MKHIWEIKETWGFEGKLLNTEPAYNKLIFMKKDEIWPFHYHKNKSETFYLKSGKVELIYSTKDDITKAKNIIFSPGTAIYISVKLRHLLIALEDSELFESSNEDIYQINN